MSELFDKRRRPDATALPPVIGPQLVPLDEAVAQHMSQVYWDWRAAFDHDPDASPLQHPDYVIAELAAAPRSTALSTVLVREQSRGDRWTIGVLVPKTIRTSQVGGLGPGWTMRGLRLAGGRFLGESMSAEQQQRLLRAAAAHAAAVGAGFLLIEDLDQSTDLYRAVQDPSLHGCRLFASREFQPRHYVDFPESAAEYWSTFSSRSLSKFRRNLKKFGTTRLERVTGIDQVPDFLRAAHAISLQSWQSRQFGLRIRNDDAELRQLSALAQHGLLRSYLWWIEGKPAAFAVCNQHGGCFRYEEIAFLSEYGQFSPGRTMLQQIVEDLLRHDSPRCLDFGGGDAEYKQQFGNRASRSGTVWLVPPTWRARCTLSYLTACRRVRGTARQLIRQWGLATRARQWLRSPRAVDAKETVVSNEGADDAAQSSPAQGHFKHRGDSAEKGLS